MKKPNQIISEESIELLRHYGYIIIRKGAIGMAQRDAVADYVAANDNRQGVRPVADFALRLLGS